MKKVISIIPIILLILHYCSGQETLTPAFVYQKNQQYLKKTTIDTISIPFFCDFSDSVQLNYFSDNNTAVATNQAILPPSIGAAMFDAIDSNNNFYATSYNQKRTADYLTSKPFNLNFPSETSIFMSFFYQPGGLLDLPEQKTDSLVLQFYSPLTEKWITVWFATNYSVREFQQVMINIKEEEFLKKGFKFRFYNTISVSGSLNHSLIANADQWFVDYIYINKDRNEKDTSKPDVAFQNPISFKLNNYQTIPLTHYENNYNEINNNIKINFRNNDNNIREIDSMYIVFEDQQGNNPNDTLFLGSYALVGNNNSTKKFTDKNFKLNCNTNEEYINYNIKAKIITDSYDSVCNNIVNQQKKLNVIYAYDDNTCENGYGLIGNGTELAYVVQKFYTYEEDQITGIQAYFNKTFKNQQPYFFYAVVWKNNPETGKPEEIIYEQPEFEIDHEKLNKYQIFKFKKPITVSDTFYIGWKKTTPNLMNIGLDANFTEEKNIFYSNSNGNWTNSKMTGALMIRPIIGKISLVKIKNIENVENKIKIYPNPVENVMRIKINENKTEK